VHAGKEPVEEDACLRQVSLRLRQLDGLTDGLLAVSQHPELASWFGGRFYHAVESLNARQDALSGVMVPPVRYAAPADTAGRETSCS
jgi:hypothetical protein